MATLGQQLEHERSIKARSVSRMRALVESADASGIDIQSTKGNLVLKETLAGVVEALGTVSHKNPSKPGKASSVVKALNSLNLEVVATIAISTALSSLTAARTDDDSPITDTGLAALIGKAVYVQCVLQDVANSYPTVYEHLVHGAGVYGEPESDEAILKFKNKCLERGITVVEWDYDTKVRVGFTLLDILVLQGNLIRVERCWKGIKSPNVVYLVDSVLDIFDDQDLYQIAGATTGAPCLIPPADWVEDDSSVGGFHGELRPKCPAAIRDSVARRQAKARLGGSDAKVIQMLNGHQHAPWKVNPFVTKVVAGMMGLGYSVDSVPRVKNTTEMSREEKRSAKSKMLTLRLALQEALEYADKEELYFVYRTDFRGRMYPVVGYMNPHGSDVLRAMLHAATGCKLETKTAVKWFKLNIATKYGVDKLPIPDCVQWVDDHHEAIMQSGSNPLSADSFSFWGKADKPLQFVALCDEYYRWITNPGEFRARIAVAMDGSCSGIQHYSALGRDYDGGYATNLVPTPGGVVEDIYGRVAEAAFIRLKESEACPSKEEWLQYGFNRKLAKKPTMTMVYGSTFRSCYTSVLDYVKDNELRFTDVHEAVKLAAHLIWDSIGGVVVAAREIMDYIQAGSKPILQDGATSIDWIAPTGYTVAQQYFDMPTKRITIKCLTKDIKVSVIQPGSLTVSKRRNRNGLAPNFIHSVDSSHMTLTTNRVLDKFGKGVFMHFVHDDFGVLPDKAEDLAVAIRETFVGMHSNYSMEDFRKCNPEMGEPPPRGKLRLADVLKSPNCFR